MIVFFVRRFNDIDHFLPVIYKCHEQRLELIVLSLDPSYNILTDPGLMYLRNKCKIKIDYAYNYLAPTLLHKVYAYFLCTPHRFSSVRKLLKARKSSFSLRSLLLQGIHDVVRYFFINYFTEKTKKIFNHKWAGDLLERLNAKILIFDWVKYYQNTTNSFIVAAKKMQIPVISLPNGVPIWSCESWEKEVVSVYGETYHFDYIVSPNINSKKIFIKGGISPETIAVLGSARFCEEWLKKYPEVYKEHPFKLKQNSRRLKIVYMDGGIKVLKDKTKLIHMIERLSRLDFVDLVIKPKTRNNRLQVPEIASYGQLVTQISSRVLCEWADVVILGPSSIFFEVLNFGKILMYPKYLFRREMVFEKLGFGWIVNSFQDLENGIKQINKDPGYCPYSRFCFEESKTILVNGGIKNRDVLGDYKDFIVEKMKR